MFRSHAWRGMQFGIRGLIELQSLSREKHVCRVVLLRMTCFDHRDAPVSLERGAKRREITSETLKLLFLTGAGRKLCVLLLLVSRPAADVTCFSVRTP